MRLISKFRDYYDGISHQYLDKEIVYLRDVKILTTEKDKVPVVDRMRIVDAKHNRTFYISLEVLGFCGELYPVVRITTHCEDLNPGEYDSYSKGFFSIDKLREYVQNNDIPLSEGRKYKWFFYHFGETLADLEKFFQHRERFNKIKDLFTAHNAPCFAVRRSFDKKNFQIVLNPLLKNYSFQKIKDPFTAHQDLFQYVGGFLRQPEREMVKLTDQEKLEKRGFDKWSFRKPPTK